MDKSLILLNKAFFIVLLVSLVLNVIVAIGMWTLYPRMERVETILQELQR